MMVIKFSSGGVGPPLFSVRNLSYNGGTENVLPNIYLITLFSAILIGLKGLLNDEGRQHAIGIQYGVKYSKKQ